jgi:hypothetical protein
MGHFLNHGDRAAHLPTPLAADPDHLVQIGNLERQMPGPDVGSAWPVGLPVLGRQRLIQFDAQAVSAQHGDPAKVRHSCLVLGQGTADLRRAVQSKAQHSLSVAKPMHQTVYGQLNYAQRTMGIYHYICSQRDTLLPWSPFY